MSRNILENLSSSINTHALANNKDAPPPSLTLYAQSICLKTGEIATMLNRTERLVSNVEEHLLKSLDEMRGKWVIAGEQRKDWRKKNNKTNPSSLQMDEASPLPWLSSLETECSSLYISLLIHIPCSSCPSPSSSSSFLLRVVDRSTRLEFIFNLSHILFYPISTQESMMAREEEKR